MSQTDAAPPEGRPLIAWERIDQPDGRFSVREAFGDGQELRFGPFGTMVEADALIAKRATAVKKLMAEQFPDARLHEVEG